MLHSHFVGSITRVFWKNVIAIDIVRQPLSTVEEWLPPKHCKPPDPIQYFITMQLESMEDNCVNKSFQLFTYEINVSTKYTIS